MYEDASGGGFSKPLCSQITVALGYVNDIVLATTQALYHSFPVCEGQLKEIVKIAVFDSMGQLVRPDRISVVPKSAQRCDGLKFSTRRSSVGRLRSVRHQ